MPGFVNLDQNPTYGDGTSWKVSDGLTRWDTGTVDAVTISHLLMYVPVNEWHALFAEIYRVLKPGGVVRITEDIINQPTSRHWHGHDPLYTSWNGRVVTCMSPKFVISMLDVAGIQSVQMGPNETWFIGADIRQNRHSDDRPGVPGIGPHVFFVEGMKP